MTDWDALELKPISLADIPSELEWCVYPEERARGEVLLPATIYRIVLALRWILTYTDPGIEADFETWKVYWKCEDKYGFKTRIFLFRERVEQYDGIDDTDVVLQEQTWVELASLRCSGGEGIISDVFMAGAQPYGDKPRVSGAMGVQRLLEDAILASRANHNYYPFHETNGYTCTKRVDGFGDGYNATLGFKLESDGYQVSCVDLKVYPAPRY